MRPRAPYRSGRAGSPAAAAHRARGSRSTRSIWAEFRPLLERLIGRRLEVRYGDWRPGDQPVYISDIGKAVRELDWRPQVAFEEGIERLVRWVEAIGRCFNYRFLDKALKCHRSDI